MVHPIGLANALSAFVRAMHRILGLYDMFVIVYLDDVLILCHSLAEHKMHVDTILLAIREAGIWLNERKSFFGATETSCIGCKVHSSGIHIAERMIAAINHKPVPAYTARIPAFLALAGNYSRFVHKFAQRTTQLYTVTVN